jgi:hypothetical protein
MQDIIVNVTEEPIDITLTIPSDVILNLTEEQIELNLTTEEVRVILRQNNLSL